MRIDTSARRQEVDVGLADNDKLSRLIDIGVRYNRRNTSIHRLAVAERAHRKENGTWTRTQKT